MNLSDYTKLNVIEMYSILRAGSLPIGTHIKRPIYPDTGDRLFINFDLKSTQTWDNGSITIQDSDVVLIPKCVAYTDHYLAEGYSIIAHIEFSPCIPAGIYRWSFQDNPEVKQRFLNLENLWKQKKPAYYSQCMRELYAILGIIIRSETSRYTNSSKSAILSPAVEYMKTNFADPNLTIPFIASLCDISYSHFRQLFYDVHGISANDFLKKLRLENACQILSLGCYTITQAAQMTGFADVYYFSSFFKKHTGVSPTEYQKQSMQKK